MRNFAFGEMNKLPRGGKACSRGVALPRREPGILGSPRERRLIRIKPRTDQELHARSTECQEATTTTGKNATPLQKLGNPKTNDETISAGHRLPHQLECNGVIECVDRGALNSPGKKGKPTMWQYRLPIMP
jgi:hypothetical protein